MTRSVYELRAELEAWKSRLREHRFLSQVARTKDDRTHHSIEAAYSAVIIGALAYALGEASSPATRIKVK